MDPHKQPSLHFRPSVRSCIRVEGCLIFEHSFSLKVPLSLVPVLAVTERYPLAGECLGGDTGSTPDDRELSFNCLIMMLGWSIFITDIFPTYFKQPFP